MNITGPHEGRMKSGSIFENYFEKYGSGFRIQVYTHAVYFYGYGDEAALKCTEVKMEWIRPNEQ